MDINSVLGKFAGAASYNIASFSNAARDPDASTRKVDVAATPDVDRPSVFRTPSRDKV